MLAVALPCGHGRPAHRTRDVQCHASCGVHAVHGQGSGLDALFQNLRLISRRLQCPSVQVVPKPTPKPGPLALRLLPPLQVSLLVVIF